MTLNIMRVAVGSMLLATVVACGNGEVSGGGTLSASEAADESHGCHNGRVWNGRNCACPTGETWSTKKNWCEKNQSSSGNGSNSGGGSSSSGGSQTQCSGSPGAASSQCPNSIDCGAIQEACMCQEATNCSWSSDGFCSGPNGNECSDGGCTAVYGNATTCATDMGDATNFCAAYGGGIPIYLGACPNSAGPYSYQCPNKAYLGYTGNGCLH